MLNKTHNSVFKLLLHGAFLTRENEQKKAGEATPIAAPTLSHNNLTEKETIAIE